MTSKKSGCGCLPILGIGVALAFGGLYFFNGRKLTPLEGAKVIPQEAIVSGYISTELKDWSELKEIGIPQEIINNNLEQIDKKNIANSNIIYQEDIKSWLGGAMFAMLPDRDEDDLLIILGVKNKLNAFRFLKKLEKKEKQQTKKIDYQGVTIIESISPKKDIMYTALVDNKVLLAIEYQTVKQAIDAYQNKSSLADLNNTQEIFSRPINIKEPLAQIYFTNYGELLKNLASPIMLWGLNSTILNQVGPIVIAIETKEKALHFQSVFNYDSQGKKLDLSSQSNNLLDEFPENTIAIISGKKINEIWQIVKSIGINSYLQQAIWLLTSATSLDLEEDVFGWMDSDFILGVIPTNTAIVPELDMGLGAAIAIKTSDPTITKNSLEKIENIIQQNSQITPSQIKNAGKTITEWSIPYNNFTLTYNWIDDNSLFFSLGDSVIDNLKKNSSNSLKKSSKFKAIFEELPQKKLGSFYLNMSSISEIINRSQFDAESNISPESIQLLNSIEGIGATASIPNKSQSQLDLLVRFK
jgi:hypothetical protein